MMPTKFADERREKHALGVGAGAGAVAGLTYGTTLQPLGILIAVIVALGALGLGVYQRTGDSTLARQLQQEAHYALGGLAVALFATALTLQLL